MALRHRNITLETIDHRLGRWLEITWADDGCPVTHTATLLVNSESEAQRILASTPDVASVVVII